MKGEERIKWVLLNIGNLSRNKFWGEEDNQSYRQAVCTSTLLFACGKVILVDPSSNATSMAKILDRRCGLKISDIDIVFMTHRHGDHLVGLENFSKAQWLMSEVELQKLLEECPLGHYDKIQGAKGEIVSGVKVVSLPGHTEGSCGLLFRAAEGRILVAGDAVLTRDFYAVKSGAFNCEDKEQCASTMTHIESMADIVIPGHGNQFLVSATKKETCTSKFGRFNQTIGKESIGDE